MAEKVARVRSRAEVAPGVLVIDCECVEPPTLSFRAGQFLSIRCAGDERRSYSMSSSPERKDGFELLVKLVPGGVGSALFDTLRPGDELRFTGPMGFFVCDLAHSGDAVFAATGTGIAPAVPMIAETLARPSETGRVLLYWGLRRPEDVFWEDRLAALSQSPRFKAHVCLSEPGPDWIGVNGRITQHVLDAVPTLDRPIYYLVGNGDMIRDLRTALLERGVDRKRQTRSEVFYPASEPVAKKG